MQSWYCGKNIWYDFCAHGDECRKGIGHSGAGHMRNGHIGSYVNGTNLAVVGKYSPEEIGAVTVF
jgi:hypothetical protein